MTQPKRIQMSRQHPWRADNPDAVIVDRTSIWGNPYRVGDLVRLRPIDDTEFAIVGWADVRITPEMAIETFRRFLSADQSRIDLARYSLRGRDLACWCSLGEPCHADVLLELANA